MYDESETFICVVVVSVKFPRMGRTVYTIGDKETTKMTYSIDVKLPDDQGWFNVVNGIATHEEAKNIAKKTIKHLRYRIVKE